MEAINADLIASCGMNCAVCRAHLREINPCHGCNFADQNMPKTRANCKIRNCAEKKGRYCYECDSFPCDRLKHLDERYRERYNMSEIANLEFIRDKGMDKFLESERQKYLQDGKILCVHDRKYY